MKKLGFKFFTLLAMAVAVSFGVTSCGNEDPETPDFNENDYVGTYYGRHLISDPTLVNIIKGLDPEQDGSFADTIIVGTGANASDKILEFESALLGVTIEADFNKSGNNVVRKDFPLLNISDSLGVVVENAVVKNTSRITATNTNTFVAAFNLSGTLKTSTINFPIGNLATSGTFTK